MTGLKKILEINDPFIFDQVHIIRNKVRTRLRKNAQHGLGKKFQFAVLVLFFKFRFCERGKGRQLITVVVGIKLNVQGAFVEKLIDGSPEYGAVAIGLFKVFLHQRLIRFYLVVE